MRQDDLMELIHGEIDGANSEADSTLLRTHLAQNPQDDRLFCELRQVATALDTAAEIEPTAGLRDQILRSIQWPEPNRLGELLNILRPTPPALKFGFAFALGSFIAIVGMQLYPELGSRSIGDTTNMVGTIVRHEPASNPANTDEVRIDEGQVAGSVVAHKADGLTVVEVELVSPEDLELVAEYASSSSQLEAVVRRGEHLPSFSRSDSTVVVSAAGDHRYALILRSTGSTDGDFTIRLYSAGEVIHEDMLPLSFEE